MNLAGSHAARSNGVMLQYFLLFFFNYYMQTDMHISLTSHFRTFPKKRKKHLQSKWGRMLTVLMGLTVD